MIVDWFGPYFSVTDACKGAQQAEFGEMLYMASGKRAYQRKAELQYVGITKNANSRLGNHRKLPEITGDLCIWWGEVASHAVAGRKRKRQSVKHSEMLTAAEHTLAYFLALPLNERLRRSPPGRSVVLVNHWFTTQEDRRYRRPPVSWPGLIEFDQEDERYSMAVRVWFGSPGRRDRLSASDIRDLAKP